MLLEDDKYEQPCSSSKSKNINKSQQQLLYADSQITIFHVVDTIGISFSVAQVIVTDNLIMHCIADKFIPACWLSNQNDFCKDKQVNDDATYEGNCYQGSWQRQELGLWLWRRDQVDTRRQRKSKMQ